MGLDLAEFLMDIEETFKIEIPEDAALEPRLDFLVDYIHQQLQGKEKRVCYSSYCFHRLRAAVSETCGVDKRSIRPSSRIADTIPRDKEIEQYPTILRTLGKLSARLPGKRFIPAVLGYFYAIATLLILALLVTPGSVLPLIYKFSVIAGVILLLIAVSRINRRYLSELIFPSRCRLSGRVSTFGDAARIMHDNMTRMKVEELDNLYPSYSRQQILSTLKSILSEQFGIKVRRNRG